MSAKKSAWLLPQEYSGLVCAVVLGSRTDLPDEQYELFQQLGIQHLLAVSGMHLALLTGMFSLLLKRLFRSDRLRILFSMAFVLFYMLLTGMSPSVSRAGIMLLLSFLAQLVSRRADAAVSLAAAVLLMLLYNPFLARNTGFLFSVFSTIGVRILAGPLSEKILSFSQETAAPKNGSARPHPILLRRFVRLCLRGAANGMVRLLPDPHVHSCQPAALPFVYTGFGRGSRIGGFLRRSAAGSVFRCSGTVFGRIVFTICPLFCPASALRLFSAAAPRLLSPFSRWPPQSDTVPLRRTAGSSPPRCASLS